MHAQVRSGSRAKQHAPVQGARPAARWGREWREAEAVERSERDRIRDLQARQALFIVVPSAVLAALAPSIFPFTLGFSTADTLAAVVVAAVTATASIASVPLADRLGRGLPRAGAGDPLVFAVALLSAGAAAIHFAVAKMHFDEYALFGVFFVGSGIAQLVWPLWLVLRRWRPLLVLGAVGNAAIVALWAVDRIWGLPLGPEHWEPERVAFADAAASAFEVLLVAGCITLLVRGRGSRVGRASALALTLAVVVVTTLGLLSVIGAGSSFLAPAQ